MYMNNFSDYTSIFTLPTALRVIIIVVLVLIGVKP